MPVNNLQKITYSGAYEIGHFVKAKFSTRFRKTDTQRMSHATLMGNYGLLFKSQLISRGSPWFNIFNHVLMCEGYPRREHSKSFFSTFKIFEVFSGYPRRRIYATFAKFKTSVYE